MWLQQAGLVYQIKCNGRPAVPLSAYDDISAFKIYVFDIGILRALSGLDASVFVEDNSLFSEFKGAYFENAVLQSLIPQYRTHPRYWVSNSGRAEVDFIIETGAQIYPIEVKAATNMSGQSLAQYIKKFSPKVAYISSSANVTVTTAGATEIIHLPHYLTDWLSGLKC